MEIDTPSNLLLILGEQRHSSLCVGHEFCLKKLTTCLQTRCLYSCMQKRPSEPMPHSTYTKTDFISSKRRLLPKHHGVLAKCLVAIHVEDEVVVGVWHSIGQVDANRVELNHTS